MPFTQARYEQLRDAHDQAASSRDHWARRIADEALAGRPIDPTMADLYRECTDTANRTKHDVTEYLHAG